METPNREELHDRIMSAYTSQNYDECLEVIEKSLKLYPNNKHKIIQAYCWSATKVNRDEAFKVLEEIIEKEPKNSFAFYGIGFAHYSEGNLRDCIENLDKAIKLNPTNDMQRAMDLKQKAQSVTDAIVDANAKYSENCFEKALKSLSVASFLDPDNESIQKNISNVRNFFIEHLVTRLEREVEADVATNCNELDVERKVCQAEKLIQKGQIQQAEKLIEEIWRVDPNNQMLAYLKGFFYYMAGSLKPAIVAFNEAHEINPCHGQAKALAEKAKELDKLIDSSNQQIVEKKYENAIATLTHLLEIDESNVQINQAAYFQRSLAHFSLGNSGEAVADFMIFQELQKDAEC